MLEILQPSQFDGVFSILKASFPPDEYRSYAGQKALLQLENYTIYTHVVEGQLAAFFALWDLDGMLFLEHFAVSAAFRNQGLGGILLQELLSQIQKPLVIEVEPPDTALAKSRIGFYERHGFFCNPYPYVQSALQEGKNPLALRIMSYPTPIDQAQFDSFVLQARTVVYAKR